MALLAEKLVHFLKLPFKLEEDSSASLRRFRLKTSVLLRTQILLKPEMMPMASRFHTCFEMMHSANRAFAELVAEIEYPMSRWGEAAAHHYLAYTSTLLDMLNSITSRLSHLNMLKVSILHGLALVEISPNSAPKYFMKTGGADFKVGKYPGIEMRAGSEKKEGVILEALIELMKIGFFTLGLVLSGLMNNDAKPGGCDDHLKKVLESRLCREMKGVVVEEVSCAAGSLAAAISAGECDEAAGKLKGRLAVMENAIMAIENEANHLFFEVLAARNKVLDNIRFA